MKRPVLKIQYDSPVVLTFALVSFIALIVNNLTNGWSNTHLFSVYRSSFADPLTYIRMLCHVLGHADFSHYFGNICLMLVIGPFVENKYGSVSLLISMAITAAVSGLVHFVFFPGVALCGASGIVFMLIFLASLAGAKNGAVPVSLILVVVLYLGREVWALFFVHDNISRLTHIIGGICGIVCGKAAGKR